MPHHFEHSQDRQGNSTFMLGLMAGTALLSAAPAYAASTTFDPRMASTTARCRPPVSGWTSRARPIKRSVLSGSAPKMAKQSEP